MPQAARQRVYGVKQYYPLCSRLVWPMPLRNSV